MGRREGWSLPTHQRGGRQGCDVVSAGARLGVGENPMGGLETFLQGQEMVKVAGGALSSLSHIHAEGRECRRNPVDLRAKGAPDGSAAPSTDGTWGRLLPTKAHYKLPLLQ